MRLSRPDIREVRSNEGENGSTKLYEHGDEGPMKKGRVRPVIDTEKEAPASEKRGDISPWG